VDEHLTRALTVGAERVAAWADLLDDINVFPIADGDTGCNLKISLAPLGSANGTTAERCRQLIASATGNSGNIAVAFLTGFLPAAERYDLARASAAGRQAAWDAVADPCPGTMLSVLDALDEAMQRWPVAPSKAAADTVIETLAQAVRSTPALLPVLKSAGVVDAGALGMFIFIEGLLRRLTDDTAALEPVDRRFDGLLKVAGPVDAGDVGGYCVNTVLAPTVDVDFGSLPDGWADSVVAVPDGDRLRVHLHTRDPHGSRATLEALAAVVDWRAESLKVEVKPSLTMPDRQSTHVMTDAAGSIGREEARSLGITLLDSYLLVDDHRFPETQCDGQMLYGAMAAGRRVSTAQASVFQQHQSYESALGRFDQVLYLAAGSAYTGNFAAASRWRATSGSAERFAIIDSQAASGRLGLLARLVARFARCGHPLEKVAAYARSVIDHCDELIFLDQLKFLVAGGRLSKSRGFFGDLLGVKPIVSPRAVGAVKVGAVRSAADQVPFALDYLANRISRDDRMTILLQYSDNEQRVRATIVPVMAAKFPRSEIIVDRFSLTAGAHMGPGTWGLACGPVNG
jgi:DegV family protein with EDD domain